MIADALAAPITKLVALSCPQVSVAETTAALDSLSTAAHQIGRVAADLAPLEETVAASWQSPEAHCAHAHLAEVASAAAAVTEDATTLGGAAVEAVEIVATAHRNLAAVYSAYKTQAALLEPTLGTPAGQIGLVAVAAKSGAEALAIVSSASAELAGPIATAQEVSARYVPMPAIPHLPENSEIPPAEDVVLPGAPRSLEFIVPEGATGEGAATGSTSEGAAPSDNADPVPPTPAGGAGQSPDSAESPDAGTAVDPAPTAVPGHSDSPQDDSPQDEAELVDTEQGEAPVAPVGSADEPSVTAEPAAETTEEDGAPAPGDGTTPTITGDASAEFAGGVDITLPDGSHVTAPNETAATAVRAALSAQGTPYEWGGTTPGVGLDCSGLTQWSYHQAGMEIGRTTWDQDGGLPVPLDEAQPGDLLLWEGHVAMVIGNGQIIEAGDPVGISSIRTDNMGMPFLGVFRPTGGDAA